MRLEAVEPEILGQATTEAAQARQKLLGAGSFLDFQDSFASRVQGHIVAFAQPQGFDDRSG
jgi:hypothetical protein